MELIYYLVLSQTGFPGLVLFRTCLLTFFLRDDWLNRDDAGRFFVCGRPRVAGHGL